MTSGKCKPGLSTWRRFQRIHVLCIILAAEVTLSVPADESSVDNAKSKEKFDILAAELDRVDRSSSRKSGAAAAIQKWDEVFSELQMISRNATESLLIPAIRSPKASSRSCAAALLGLAPDRRAVVPLIAALADGNSTVRCCAALALGRIGDVRAVPPLIAALDSKDIGFRWQVEEALGQLKDPRAIKPLLQVLMAQKDLYTCYSGAPMLIIVLKDIDPEYVYDPPPARALAKIGAPAIRDLVESLPKAERPVREALAITLGEIGPPAIEPLTPLLKHANSDVRTRATVALGMAGDGRVVDILIAALSGDDYWLGEKAEEALGRIGDPRATEPLRALLQDKAADLASQRAAARALRKIEEENAGKLSEPK